MTGFFASVTGLSVGTGVASLGNLSTQALPVRPSTPPSSFLPTSVVTTVTSIPPTTPIPPVATSPIVQSSPISAISAVPLTIPQSSINAPINPGVAQGLIASSVYFNAPVAAIALPVRSPFLSPLEIANLAPTLTNLSTITIPPVVRRAVNFILPAVPPPQRYRTDSLTVTTTTIDNNSFVPVEKNGITAFRPEILSVVDFKPIYLGPSRELTSTGKLIDLVYQARLLREQILYSTISSMERSNRNEITGPFNELKNSFAASLTATRNIVNFYARTIDEIELVKKGLDIKDIPATAYDTTNYLTLVDFFERRMQFSRTSFNIFSDTKILMQLLFDLRSCMENYSLSLLNLSDNDRTNDINPVRIDKTYTTTNGFSFSVAGIQSLDSAQNAAQSRFFTNFVNSLPVDVDDKIKLILTVLSKELRVSKGLSKPENKRALQESFNSQDVGNPFDNIIGTIGESIFVKPLGDRSMASVFTLDLGANSVVLPFENKYVDSDETRTTFVPGSNYFVESILNVQNGTTFNTRPLVDYTNTYTNKSSVTKSIIENLFELRDGTTKISSLPIFKRYILALKNSIAGLVNQRNTNHDQAITSALFKLATTDRQLKLMLFQYLILLGISTLTKNDQKKIFERSVFDLRNIIGLSYVRATIFDDPDMFGGTTELYPFLQQLATDIEERVLLLVNGTSENFSIPPVREFQRSPAAQTLRTGIDQTLINVSAISGAPLISRNQSTIISQTSTLVLRRGSIRSSLLSANSSTSIASSNLVKEFIDISNYLDQNSQVTGASESYVLSDQSGRTRYNFLSSTTILLLIYELLTNFSSKYTFANFVRSSDLTSSTIEIDTEANSFMQVIFDDFLDRREETRPISISTINPILAPLPIARDAVVSRNTNLNLAGANLSSVASVSSFVTYNASTITNASNLASSIRTPAVSRIDNFSAQATNSLLNIPPLIVPPVARNAPVLTQLAQSPLLGTINLTINSSTLIPRIASVVALLPNLSQGIPQRLITLRNALTGIKNKIYDEETILANFLHILSVIGNRLSQTKDRAVTFFTTTQLTTVLSDIRAQQNTSINTNATQVLSTILNPEQVRTSIVIYDKYVGSLNRNNSANRPNFVQTNTINSQTRNSLFSLLSEQQFRQNDQRDSRTKLLTIGIPSGFSKKLSERINGRSINSNSFSNKQFDVISINVYKRNAEYDDIVFKPQKFIFDLSLFGINNGLTSVSSEEQFNRIIQRVQLSDYEKPSAPVGVNLSSIINNEKYSFLNDQEKQNMMRNHFVSDLLNAHISLLTGIKLDEETFADYQSSTTQTVTDNFDRLVLSYLELVKNKPVRGKTIDEIINSNDPTIDDETKDLVKLLKFGNVAFQPEFVATKVLSPKMFDRVFTIPLDIEAFEVDVRMTEDTQSGRAAYNKDSFRKKIDREIVDNNGRVSSSILKKRLKEDLVFDDYFVNIELVG